jgi:glutamine synthetase
MLLAEYAGDQAETVPRAVLRRQVARAAGLGLAARAAFEFEWLVYDETASSLRDKQFTGLTPWAVDNRCWDGLSAAIYAEPIRELEALLRSGGIGLLGLGMELGPGCLEGTLAATDPISAADEAALFKLYTKAFFRRRNQTAVFMSQPDADAPGLSGHIHLSLRDKRGRNLFYDAKSPDRMSAAMRHFVGGVLALLPECAALPLHTVNAYRRLSPGNWAPRTATWSVQNYSTAIRAVTDNADRCRLEFRLPGADVHPHLALAMFLGAGLWGVEQRIEPPVPVISDGRVDVPVGTPPLPHDLRLAADALSASKVAADLFGEAFVERFVQSRRHEFQALQRAVSAAEKARYFEAM